MGFLHLGLGIATAIHTLIWRKMRVNRWVWEGFRQYINNINISSTVQFNLQQPKFFAFFFRCFWSRLEESEEDGMTMTMVLFSSFATDIRYRGFFYFYELFIFIWRLHGSHGSLETGKVHEFEKNITSLEKALIFVKTLLNREKSLILINLWCFAELILKNITQRRQLVINGKKKVHLNKDVV